MFASLLVSSLLAAPCPVRPDWPTDDWPVQLVTRDLRAKELDELEAFAFTLTGDDAARKGTRTDGLIIIKHGVIVYERYARGFDASKRHISWSVAKSFTSALIGIAEHHGLLSLSDSVCTHLPEFSGQPVCDVSVEHLLTFSSGLDWQEEYEKGQTYQVSSVIAMLFGVGHRDQLGFILGHRLVATPGERWLYSTGDSQALSAIAQRVLSRRFGRDAFWSQLYERIGMKRVVQEFDERENPQGASTLYATPRDFAKFGFLFLNDGCWAGERLVPEDWVRRSTTPSRAYVKTLPSNEPRPSGYSWWLNAALPEQGRPKPWADVPEDAYAASGHWGQRIVVVPSEDVVLVRFGDDRESAIDANGLIKRALDVAR